MNLCSTAYLVLFLIQQALSQTQLDKRIVCYYGDWRKQDGTYNITFRMPSNNMDAFLCTHIVYALIMPDLNDGIAAITNTDLLTLVQDDSVELVKLKMRNPDVKLMISVGSWTEGSVRFSRISADPERRRRFAESTSSLLRTINFDGLDLNWQWPGTREGHNANDKDNYIQLIKDVKEYFEQEALQSKKKALILSVVVPPFKESIAAGFNLKSIIKYADFLNLLTMDYHLSTEPLVDHPSPLYSIPRRYFNQKLTVDSTVKQYIDMGIDPVTMNLGIALYGRSFTLEDSLLTELGSPSEDEGDPGYATKAPGVLAYFEICRHIKDDGWQINHPNVTAMGPIAYLNKNWVAYDDAVIIEKKVRYANEKGFGGVMVWTIDFDDFKGYCSEPYPLMRAVREFRNPVPLDNVVSDVEQVSPTRTDLRTKVSPSITTSTQRTTPKRTLPESTTNVNWQKTDPSLIFSPTTQQTKHNPELSFNPLKSFGKIPNILKTNASFHYKHVNVRITKNCYDMMMC